MLKIGLIDSGMGGISVLKGLIDSGIKAEFYYLYDNKYHPYGKKTASELVAIGYTNMQKMLEFGVNIVIIACNTLTSTAVAKLRSMFDIPIIGVEPPIKPATISGNNILLLATPATIKSDRVVEMIHNYTSKNFFFPDMSLLANLIETNYDNTEIVGEYLEESLAKYNNIDGVVIGCTHYNFILPEIEKIFTAATIFTNIDGVVRRTSYIINKNKLISPNYTYVKLFTTGEQLEANKKYFLCKYIDFGIEFM